MAGGRGRRVPPEYAARRHRGTSLACACCCSGAWRLRNEGLALVGAGRKAFAAKRSFVVRRDFAAKRNLPQNLSNRLQVDLDAEESVDVIDLGAPRALRRAPLEALAPAEPRRARRVYTPNPRLYPGPAPKPKPKRRSSTAGRGGHRRVFRRPVPNSRLYRPAPRRLPPPAEPPRGPWPPPAPPARPLDTASRAALRLFAQRPTNARTRNPESFSRPSPKHLSLRHSAGEPIGRSPSPSVPPTAPPTPRSRRLVVTLPAASARAGAAGMDARRSSPDDCSDNDALSAPSEFLAEFLSAIMRRQHVEALKYCRLILQYEPHNATARGFYPLLRHKVQALQQNEGAAGAGARAGSSSGSSAGSPAPPSPRSRSDTDPSPPERSGGLARARGRVVRARSACGSRSGSGSRSESGGSVASQSSLELDSSSASVSAAAGISASESCSASRSRSEPDSSDARDDNGNVPAPSLPRSDDVENDNDVPNIKSESSSSSLRRLRAQFACSIK